MPFVAEAPDVELEAFQLDAELVGDVIQRQHGEIRLPGLGTEAGEFRDFHVDLVIPVRRGVGEGFERLGGGLFLWAGHAVRGRVRGAGRIIMAQLQSRVSVIIFPVHPSCV
jgi:hypothetical protein